MQFLKVTTYKVELTKIKKKTSNVNFKVTVLQYLQHCQKSYIKDIIADTSGEKKTSALQEYAN